MLKEVHDFHLVINQKLKEKLRTLKVFQNCNGLSRIIVSILEILAPIVKDEHNWGEQRMSQYRPVCKDPDEVREHVHVYMPLELYRKLKLLHQDLNVFSIAQLIRDFIGWFLDFVEGCKGDVLKKLKKMFTQSRAEELETKLTEREFMRQLWKIIHHLPGKNRLINIYNRDFSPFYKFII
jgi:hypothetical protein